MINLNGIRLKNRFIVAAGPWSFYWKKWPFLNPSEFGAFTTNTFTKDAREGNLEFVEIFNKKVFPKIWKVLRRIPNGWINSSGWRNPGIHWAVREFYPRLKEINTNIIFSIGGFKVVDYLFLIEKLNPLDLSAIELNISCPNVGLLKDFEMLETLFSEAKRCSNHPLIVKIGADDPYLEIVARAKEAGINAVNAINTIGIPFSKFKNQQGGMGGKRIKHIGLGVVKKLNLFFDIPIIATSGIYSFEDCQDFFMVKAGAVSFASVFFSRPWAPRSILKKFQSGA